MRPRTHLKPLCAPDSPCVSMTSWLAAPDNICQPALARLCWAMEYARGACSVFLGAYAVLLLQAVRSVTIRSSKPIPYHRSGRFMNSDIILCCCGAPYTCHSVWKSQICPWVTLPHSLYPLKPFGRATFDGTLYVILCRAASPFKLDGSNYPM